jgi:hypothetical protein
MAHCFVRQGVTRLQLILARWLPKIRPAIRTLTLSRLGAPLVHLLESSVHESAYSGPINIIPSAKWVCYVLPIHVACSIMQIRPLVPKIQQVTGLRGR